MDLQVKTEDDITPTLEELQEKAENLRDPLEEVGDIAISSVHETIDTEGRGTWDPAQVPTGHPLLYDTGALYEAVQYNVQQDHVDIDDGMSYASYQNNMREFMYVDDSAEKEIEEILSKHFSDI